MNERLLVAVAHSRAAIPVSAKPCHSVARSECPRKVQGGEAAVEQSVEAQATLGSDRSQMEALSADQRKYGHSAGEIQNKAGFVDGTVKSCWNSIVTSDETASIVGNIAIIASPSRANRRATPRSER
jgi:hypothetical protein